MLRHLSFHDFADPLERSLDRLERQEIVPDKATFVALLSRCIREDDLRLGKRVHAQIARAGRDGETFVANHLVEMYGKCGCVAGACATFDGISERNVRSWNIMLAAYARARHLEVAEVLFEETPEKNVVTWNTMLALYSDNGIVSGAWKVFKSMPEKDMVSWNTILTALTRFGNLEEAKSLLFQMPHRDVSSWNAMITGYARAGEGRAALRLFSAMDLEGQRPNLITFAGAIGACMDLDTTLVVHSAIAAPGLDTDTIVAVSLVTAYGRHGSIESAKRCFDGIARKDVVAWTALMTAYSQNGLVHDSIRLFRLMSLDGTKPCKVTLLTIFHACSTDASSAPAGRSLHESLAGTGMDLDVAVGTALIDMYGNAGKLAEAWSAFDKLPRKNVASWSAIIAANAQSGHSGAALELFREMLVEGMELNEITVLSALSACSRGGLVDDGRSLFSGVESDFQFARNVEHYQCAMDLLGRAGQLELAEELMSSMPFQPGSVAAATVVAACHTHGNVETGLRAAAAAAASGGGGAGSFMSSEAAGSSSTTSSTSSSASSASSAAVAAAVLISNIYSTSL